jgi:hypothetical protein
VTEKPCRWDDAMFEASTLGLPAPQPKGYGKQGLASQRAARKRKEKEAKKRNKRKAKS